jgi:hypothetical protein
MRPAITFALSIIIAAAVACGQHTGGEGNRNSGGAGGGGGSTTTQTARTTIAGCFQADDKAGGYVLRATDGDHADKPTATAGGMPGKNAGSVFTGRGGDQIANAPTIGGHESAGQVYVVVPEGRISDFSQYAGKRVSIDGLLQSAAVLHASSIRTIADDCAAQSSGR